MTEHDTPSTARTEAKRATRAWMALGDDRVPFENQETYGVGLKMFEAGAEWALAQVIEGLEALDIDYGTLGRAAAYNASDALAVVDRLAGKP